MVTPMPKLRENELSAISERTRAHYQRTADSFWTGTRDHDVSQNIDALIDAIDAEPPLRILDFGCGPGRDLRTFVARGHEPVGLDGTVAFVEMARANAGVEVWHQDFLQLDLPPERFDGVFANASLFHVPVQELPQVLRRLSRSLVPGGILFASNPRGDNREGWNGERYASYHDLEAWTALVLAAGFEAHSHYYRPPGLPREQQPWLATLWRKPAPVDPAA